MISTVTTATVSTITTASMAGSFAFIGTLVLLALLLQKELASASSGTLMERISHILDIGLYPLLFAFSLIVIFSIISVIR